MTSRKVRMAFVLPVFHVTCIVTIIIRDFLRRDPVLVTPIIPVTFNPMRLARGVVLFTGAPLLTSCVKTDRPKKGG